MVPRFFPVALALLVWFFCEAGANAASRNLFGELLGKSEAETTARIEAAWRLISAGDPETERLYFEAPDETAYIADIGNGDVRSEGMSYGLMLAIQLDRQEAFNRLWKWAYTHMRHASGPRRGYFTWQCAYDGRDIGGGVSASDGEEWIVTALFFASHRWGDGEGIFAYSREAQALLREMLHKPGSGEGTAIFDREAKQVNFCPIGRAATITDPSYHLPHFYVLWSRWAEDPADRRFWAEAAAISREFFRKNAHPETGLMSEYAHFDGRPYSESHFGAGKDEFGFDAWRTLAHVALDHAWGSGDAWQRERTDRALRFLGAQGDRLVNRYTLDGRPLTDYPSPGLIAMAAAAGVASDPQLARPFVKRLWEAPMPTGKWRYYDGLLTLLGLLQASGRFQVFDASSGAPVPVVAPASGLPFVSPLFGDHMVLQRGKPNPIWGWTRPGAEVWVRLANRTVRAVAGADGRWSASVVPPAPGGPYILEIAGAERRVFNDVLVGDVWLCGGQSNMEMSIGRTSDAAEVIAAADRPDIRFFQVGSQVAYERLPVVKGEWTVCTPETITAVGGRGFSAVGYHFGRRLQEELQVPIGLVQSCVGGTPAESWTSVEALRPLGFFDEEIAEVDRLRARGGPQHGNYIAHWYDEHDVGQRDSTWASPQLDESGWTAVDLRGGFAALGVPNTPALVYFRRTFILPDPLPSGDARLQLGVVERMDTAWVNGQWVGASAWVENPRDYALREGVLRPGVNQITIRVFKTAADGGFRSPGDRLKLLLGDRSEIPLDGEWRGRVAVDARPPHPLPVGFENWPVMPGVLHNGMIAPLAPFALSGAIWYQGEANVGRAAQYRVLLPAMIADWRRTFGQGDFPFYIVSLAAFMARRETPPAGDGWAELREAQARAASSVVNSGLALAIDKGDANDIHPRDKREVGERLALQALAGHYGKAIPASGPVFRSAEPVGDGSALRLTFDHVDGGLVMRGEELGEFSLAGEDLVWAWAQARLEGDTVLVSASSVPRPKFVRYAWQANPRATLYNGAGLPAVPFRTDQSDVTR